MAITSELIGKLGGGADVEVTPVEGAASGNSGSREVLHTVEVPEGRTWLVAVYGDLSSTYSGQSASVQLYIGTTLVPNRARSGTATLAHVGTGTIEVGLKRNGGSRTDSFTGHVYVAKL